MPFVFVALNTKLIAVFVALNTNPMQRYYIFLIYARKLSNILQKM